MENRITNQIDAFLQRTQQRFLEVLGEQYHELSGERQSAMGRLFSEAIDEILAMVKKGKDAHQRFVETIVVSALDPIIGLDEDSRIFFWNRGAESVFEYTKAEVMGSTVDILLPDESYRAEHERIARETLEYGYVRTIQTYRKTHSGRVIPVGLSQTLIRDPDDGFLGAVAILRDMTQWRLSEQQMIQAEKLAVAGQLAAGIAHEVGTPLSIISGIAEYLLLDRGTGHPEREDLETIMTQTDRIARMIRELLVSSRPQPLRKERLSLNDELLRAVNLLKSRFEKIGVEVICRLADASPAVNADANQLQQVFLNLIINACDSLSENDGPRLLTITTRHTPPLGTDPGESVVLFEDNGPGIPSSVIDHVFDPFVTTKDPGKGTGLGLAVCSRIMDQHNGSIDAANRDGGGARFRLRFAAAPTA